ncbi:MAG: DUF998 domain-containing protein [Candidatus Bathyarchaeia archaeon]
MKSGDAGKHPRLHVDSQMFPTIALAGISYFGLAVLILHALPTGYSPLNQAVSDYGVGQYAWLMDTAFIAIGIGTVSLAISLSKFTLGSYGGFGVRSLYVSGVCFFLVGFFPTDLEGTSVTFVGAMHTLLSVIVFLGNILAALTISRGFLLSEPLRPFYKSSLILAVAEVVILVITKPFMEPSASIRGLAERAFIFSFYLWLLLASIRVRRVFHMSGVSA